jgi:hypothetical protein
MMGRPLVANVAALSNRLRRNSVAACPTVPPIQEIAARARRLKFTLETLPVGTSYVRSTGIAQAYDQTLAVACQQLEVPNRLLDVPPGKLRILERIRVEFFLGEAGLSL